MSIQPVQLLSWHQARWGGVLYDSGLAGLVNVNSVPSSQHHRTHPVHSAFKLLNQ
ncbi:hypothetical protein AVEN_111170-1, partial [Araneus ventricosus]